MVKVKRGGFDQRIRTNTYGGPIASALAWPYEAKVKKLRRILLAIAVPGAADQPGADKAFLLAKATGAEVELFHAAWDAEADGSNRDRVVQLRELQLRRIAMARQPPDSSAALKVVWSSNANSAIVAEARRYRADLVVGHSARRGVARFLLTYHDWHLIRELNQPLLLVKSARPWKGRDIVVAIDPLHAHDKPAALDRRLLAAGRAFAGWTAGTLRAFHVHAPALSFLPGTALHPIPTLAPPAEQRRRARAIRARVLRLTRAAGLPASRVEVETGDVEHKLPDCALNRDAAVVVLGAISRSLLGRWLIGSTAERVLDKLQSDVLILHPARTT
jgi:universal stress protein E